MGKTRVGNYRVLVCTYALGEDDRFRTKTRAGSEERSKPKGARLGAVVRGHWVAGLTTLRMSADALSAYLWLQRGSHVGALPVE